MSDKFEDVWKWRCELIKAAAEYETLGYVTFPCDLNKQGKMTPLFRGFNHLSAIQDIDDLEARYDRIHTTAAQLAISTSSNILVIDVDAKYEGDGNRMFRGRDGEVLQGLQLKEWFEDRYEVMRNCPLSRSPSGGYHFYLSGDEYEWSNITQQTRIWTPFGHLEADSRPPFKGCVKEYPSRNSAGLPYKWIRPLVHKSLLPPCPAELYDWFAQWSLRRQETTVITPTGHDNSRGIGANAGDVLGLDLGIHEGRPYRRLTVDDKRLPKAIYWARKQMFNEAKYPRGVGGRQKTLLPLANMLWWGFLLPDTTCVALVQEWCDAAQYYDITDINERIATARRSIPSTYHIGWGIGL